MATVDMPCFENKEDQVLSDVHVCLLYSDKMGQMKDHLERQKWLSRFHFWLPHTSEKVAGSLEIMCMSAEQTDTLNSDEQPTCVPDKKQAHDSQEKQAHDSPQKQAHDSSEKQVHDFLAKQTHDPQKKQVLELDDDGDVLLIRRGTQCSSQESPGNLKRNNVMVDLSHASECDTDVLLPTRSDSSLLTNYMLGSTSDSCLASENCVELDRRRDNSSDTCVHAKSYSDLDTKVVSFCDQKVTIPCQINRSIFSKIHNSKHQGHTVSLPDKRLDKDTGMPQGEKRDVGVLTLEHSLETSLPEVGFQVWSGALLLCDYLIHNHKDLENSIVLDLGSGTGITSIIAAMFAPYVVCTDYLSDILALGERNWQRNRDLLPRRACNEISFKVLDWMSQDVAAKGQYDIMPADLKLIEAATLILAAEVIYDEELTDAFFRTIYQLFLKSPAKTVLLTVERRIIFSAANQDICSPAYEHFLENLSDLVSVDEGPVYFTAEKVATQFPQYFQYNRVKELELWQISSHLAIPV